MFMIQKLKQILAMNCPVALFQDALYQDAGRSSSRDWWRLIKFTRHCAHRHSSGICKNENNRMKYE